MARMSATKTIIKTETWNKGLSAGDSVEGYFVGKEVFEGQYGETTKYIVVDGAGKNWGIYGSASLDRQFKNIPEGCYVWVTFDGDVTSKNGRTVKQYSVDYDPELVK